MLGGVFVLCACSTITQRDQACLIISTARIPKVALINTRFGTLSQRGQLGGSSSLLSAWIPLAAALAWTAARRCRSATTQATTCETKTAAPNRNADASTRSKAVAKTNPLNGPLKAAMTKTAISPNTKAINAMPNAMPIAVVRHLLKNLDIPASSPIPDIPNTENVDVRDTE